jgi:uncharacterized repeat protein (TIGR03943 family)
MANEPQDNHEHEDEHEDEHDNDCCHEHEGEGGHDHGHDHDRADSHTLRRIGTWVEAGTILLIAAFFAFSYFSGRVRFFVASYYIWLSAMAAAALLAMGLTRLLARSGAGCSACESGEHGTWRVPVWICVAVLVVPVALALAVDPRRYSPEGLRKRRVGVRRRDVKLERAMNWVLGVQAARRGASALASLPSEPTVLDVLNAAEAGSPEALAGRFVELVGQCDLPDGPGSKRMDLYRVVVTCCVADATAISIEVARRANVRLEPGGWVRVAGVIKFDSQFDPALPVVHATMISKIPEPSDPYL